MDMLVVAVVAGMAAILARLVYGAVKYNKTVPPKAGGHRVAWWFFGPPKFTITFEERKFAFPWELERMAKEAKTKEEAPKAEAEGSPEKAPTPPKGLVRPAWYKRLLSRKAKAVEAKMEPAKAEKATPKKVKKAKGKGIWFRVKGLFSRSPKSAKKAAKAVEALKAVEKAEGKKAVKKAVKAKAKKTGSKVVTHPSPTRFFEVLKDETPAPVSDVEVLATSGISEPAPEPAPAPEAPKSTKDEVPAGTH